MELGKEEKTLSENKEQEKIAIVIDGNKKDKTKVVEDRIIKDNRPFKERWKEEFSSRKFRGGAYSSALIVFILVAVVLVNMIVGQFDLKVDVTEESTYTLTEQTKDLLKGIKDEVTIYYIVENGKESELFQNIVAKYGEFDNVSVVYKDPVLYPDFATQYAGAGTVVSNNSIVVVNETTGSYKYIAYSSMLDLDYTGVYNGTAKEADVTAIDVEGQITSAIAITTSDKRYKMYVVQGHGESLVNDYMKNEYQKLATDVEVLNIRSVGDGSNSLVNDDQTSGSVAIPDDCDILYISGPTTDYTEKEVEAVKTYLQGGGKAIVMLNSKAQNMTNFNSLLEYYGLKVTPGVVVERSDHISGGVPYFTYVDITNTNSLTVGINNSTNPVFMPLSQAISETSTRSTVTLQQILTTTQDAYCKTNAQNDNYEREDTDVSGPFDACVLVSEAYQGNTSEMVVFSSDYITQDKLVEEGTFGNATILNNTISYMVGQTTGMSIPKRSMKETYLTTTEADTTFYSVVLIVALPVVLLLAGFIIWYMRRRRA